MVARDVQNSSLLRHPRSLLLTFFGILVRDLNHGDASLIHLASFPERGIGDRQWIADRVFFKGAEPTTQKACHVAIGRADRRSGTSRCSPVQLVEIDFPESSFARVWLVAQPVVQ